MLSKSMPDMSPPQLGIGRFSNRESDFRRKFRIHSGSLFIHDISCTMSVVQPFLGLEDVIFLVAPAEFVSAEI